MEISQLKEIMEAFDKSSAAVLEVHEGNLSIYLEKDAKFPSDHLPPIPPMDQDSPESTQDDLAVEEASFMETVE